MHGAHCSNVADERLRAPLLTVGARVVHKAFVWCSLSKQYAQQFACDTHRCYTDQTVQSNGRMQRRIDFGAAVPVAPQQRIVLQINVPAGTRALERFVVPDFAPEKQRSEIILQRGTTLQIVRVSSVLCAKDFVQLVEAHVV